LKLLNYETECVHFLRIYENCLIDGRDATSVMVSAKSKGVQCCVFTLPITPPIAGAQ